MGKSAKPPRPKVAPPQIFAATLGKMGEVTKEAPLTEPEAIDARRRGEDVVVCGMDLVANIMLAQRIEGAATGNRQIHHAAHASAGPHALSHFQPQTRPPDGHTFYESAPSRIAH